MKTGPSDQTYIQLNVWQTRLTRQATYTTAAQKCIEIEPEFLGNIAPWLVTMVTILKQTSNLAFTALGLVKGLTVITTIIASSCYR